LDFIKLKESTGLHIVILFGIVLSITFLILWYISLRVPIFEQNGNLTNTATITIEIAIGIFIATSILIAERNWQGKITSLITRSETILANHAEDRNRRMSFAVLRLESELGRMKNWVSVTNQYIDDYTKEKNKPEPVKNTLDHLTLWLKVMDDVRNENISVLKNIVEFSNEVFEKNDLYNIEDLIRYGKSFYIPHQRSELLLPPDFRDESTPAILQIIQELEERIKDPRYNFSNKS